jgi:SAM-dependent methyltransferase
LSATSNTDVTRRQGLRRRLEAACLSRSERVWRRLPVRTRDLKPLRAYGAWAHALVGRHADREMYLGTQFLRNRPQLELMCRLVRGSDLGACIEIAVIGCSIGVEAYSIVWALRRCRPDLELAVRAVDLSPEAIDVAEGGVYTPELSRMVHSSIFEGLTEAEHQEMFDWDGDAGTVKSWLRDGISWQVGDAADPGLVARLGPKDLVVANNFLCHMPAQSAERCLRNLARLVRPGGHVFVTGVDLDVRTKVARDLGWEPISELRAEIHDGDPLVRADWPWRWWGLERLERNRPDWEMRYSAAFRIPANS